MTRRLMEIETRTLNERDITNLATMNGRTLEQEIILRKGVISARYTYRIDDDSVTDWQAFAADYVSGDRARLARHLPPGMRP